eukprot:6796367-Pyramimonas_sp.AAC.1
MKKYLIKALLPGKVHILSRKDWVSSHRPFGMFGLLEAVHGLLGHGFRRWSGKSFNDGNDGITVHGSRLALLDQDVTLDDGPQPHHEYKDMDWAARNKCAKRGFNTWLDSHQPLHI